MHMTDIFRRKSPAINTMPLINTQGPCLLSVSTMIIPPCKSKIQIVGCFLWRDLCGRTLFLKDTPCHEQHLYKNPSVSVAIQHQSSHQVYTSINNFVYMWEESFWYTHFVLRKLTAVLSEGENSADHHLDRVQVPTLPMKINVDWCCYNLLFCSDIG